MVSAEVIRSRGTAAEDAFVTAIKQIGADAGAVKFSENVKTAMILIAVRMGRAIPHLFLLSPKG